VTDLAAELTDFGETAAAIANLDLVIDADTVLVHLAGALGKPVWTMLPFAPDWRWLLARSDSPWYAAMRLFRQPRPGDWDSVAAAVRRALADRAAQGVRPRPDAAARAEYVALVNAANEHHQAKRHAECEAALRRALDIDPANGSALHVLALTRHALDDKEEAVELMQKAVALEPAMATYHRDLAIMLHGTRRFEDALESSRRAIELDPDDAATHNGLGATFSELGRPAEAIAAFRRALDIKPVYHECWGNLAHAQQALLQLDEAADSYRRALGIRYRPGRRNPCCSSPYQLHRGDPNFATGYCLEIGPATASGQAAAALTGLGLDYIKAANVTPCGDEPSAPMHRPHCFFRTA
jgi:tetratricopeptide (TPR) repeat protein